MMTKALLVLNAGSSSLKFAAYDIAAGGTLGLACRGMLEGIGPSARFTVRDGPAPRQDEGEPGPAPQDHESLLAWIDRRLGDAKLVAVGHRVVHGGPDFTTPALLTPTMLSALEALTPLAPLHQPHGLAPVRAIAALRPDLPQVACFDTAFHRTIPAVATRLALPRSYGDEGVRRYGFHGLSYEWIAQGLRETSPRLAAGRVIVAHLGNGASLCAMERGRSIDTTMSFTALDGLMMGTRCGALDPGVVLYMLQQKGLSPGQVEQVLYRQSGLLGTSGLSADMRTLQASADPHARKAIELFVYRVAREAAALAGSLGGLDGFVFTGGIGEHAAEVRLAICERLRWLGVVPHPDPATLGRISAPDSRVEVLVMSTDEEAMIARHTLETHERPEGAKLEMTRGGGR